MTMAATNQDEHARRQQQAAVRVRSFEIAQAVRTQSGRPAANVSEIIADAEQILKFILGGAS